MTAASIPATSIPATSIPATSVSHLVPLEGTTWSVWRDVAIRGAGFPADMMLAICDEPLARSADVDVARRRDRPGPEYDAVYAEATGRLSRAIAGIHADPYFQEAVTWQNPRLAEFLRDRTAAPVAVRRTKDRQRELVIANYLQRYCLKNDSIGFYGPVGWASANPGTAGLVVLPGERLISRRTTYFEVWAIDKVAAAIAGRGRMAGWLRPRRTASSFLAGNVLHRALRRPVVLTDAELEVLAACDGSTTISDVLAIAGEQQGRVVLARLAELGAVRLDLEGPVDARPERLLLDQVSRIADPAERARAVAPVERMIEAKDEVAASAGDPSRLAKALADLAATFEEITGAQATRKAGGDVRRPHADLPGFDAGRAGRAGRGAARGAGRPARAGPGQRPLAGE